MEKEKSEIAREQGKKEEEKRVSQQYRAFLEDQMIKEAEDTKDVDAHRKKESEKIWIKRDNDKKAQDDARAALMHEVDIGRREQALERAGRARAPRRTECQGIPIPTVVGSPC